MQKNKCFEEWINTQKKEHKSVVAIVDPHSDFLPHQVFYRCDGQDGGPLLSLKILTNPEDGPWMLPVNPRFLEWWGENNNAQSGILIATKNINQTREHFSSLFLAILEGERVFFPFYRPSYLAPILPRLYQDELNTLLAGHSILLKEESGWINYQSQYIEQVAFESTPWWVIKEHHVSSAPNLPLLVTNIETWLWQYQHELMHARINRTEVAFSQQFQEYFQKQDDSHPLTLRLVTAALESTVDESALSHSEVVAVLHSTQNEEFIYALKQTFAQLRGIS